MSNFLNTISKFPQSPNEKSIAEKELFGALKSMPNEKSPGNDCLSKEFFETF